MKIVHMLPMLTKGGGERVAADLANAAAAAGHEVTVVAARKVDEGLLRNRLNSGIDVQYIATGSAGRFASYAHIVPWILGNWRWIMSRDVIHCHLTHAAVTGSLIWLLRRLSRVGRPAVIETYHSVGMPIPNWQRALRSQLFHQRDAVALMADDPYWTRFAQRTTKFPVVTIPNGVDVARGKVAAEQLETYCRKIGIPSSCKMIFGTVGQMRPSRRPLDVVRVFARAARETTEDVHFLFVGDGSELGAVRAAIRAEGLEGRIHTPGLAREPRVPMSVMDLYLTLNVGRTTGIAGLEATFADAPLIALQLDESFQPGGEDWIWSHHKPGAVAARGIELLRDEKTRKALSKCQRQHAEAHYSVKAMWAAYEILYRQVFNAVSA